MVISIMATTSTTTRRVKSGSEGNHDAHWDGLNMVSRAAPTRSRFCHTLRRRHGIAPWQVRLRKRLCDGGGGLSGVEGISTLARSRWPDDITRRDDRTHSIRGVLSTHAADARRGILEKMST